MLPKVFEKSNVNDVSLSFDGKDFSGWKEVTIDRSIESISGGFSLSIMDIWRPNQDAWEIVPGIKVDVKIGGEQIIRGYIDSVESSFTAQERTITVEGRDLTGDLVDCSLVTDKSQYRNQTIEQLAKKFCEPFGISVKVETDVGKPFPKWDVRQGETVFENLERMAKLRGLLLISDNFGNLVITKAGESRSSGQIVQGSNLISGQASYDDSERYSEYLVKGQRAGNDTTNGKNSANLKDQAEDQGIERYRPLLVIGEGGTDKAVAKDRAKWEATTRLAKSFRIECTVQGWRKSDGSLWNINEQVRVSCPFAGVNTDLLISSVSYNKSIVNGTITSIQLVRPDAFKPQDLIPKSADPTKGGGISSFFPEGF